MKKSLLNEFKAGAKEGAVTFLAPLKVAANAVRSELRRQGALQRPQPKTPQSK